MSPEEVRKEMQRSAEAYKARRAVMERACMFDGKFLTRDKINAI